MLKNFFVSLITGAILTSVSFCSYADDTSSSEVHHTQPCYLSDRSFVIGAMGTALPYSNDFTISSTNSDIDTPKDYQTQVMQHDKGYGFNVMLGTELIYDMIFGLEIGANKAEYKGLIEKDSQIKTRNISFAFSLTKFVEVGSTRNWSGYLGLILGMDRVKFEGDMGVGSASEKVKLEDTYFNSLAVSFRTGLSRSFGENSNYELLLGYKLTMNPKRSEVFNHSEFNGKSSSLLSGINLVKHQLEFGLIYYNQS